jgi:hypothetical protein
MAAWRRDSQPKIQISEIKCNKINSLNFYGAASCAAKCAAHFLVAQK